MKTVSDLAENGLSDFVVRTTKTTSTILTSPPKEREMLSILTLLQYKFLKILWKKSERQPIWAL